MWDFAISSEHIARKEYDCDAWPWIDNSNFGEEDFSAEEWEKIKEAESQKFKILPGTRYLKTVGKWEGEFTVFRCRSEINEICLKHGLYDT